MRFEPRRALPWVAWVLAAGAAAWLNADLRGLGSAPAIAQARTVSLSSPDTVKVLTVDVAVGDTVAAGQVVARLDPTRIDAALAGARVDLERFAAQDLSGWGREAAQLERTNLQLAELDADDQRDRAQLKQLDEQLERQNRLVAEQLTSVEMSNQLKLQRAALAQKVQSYAEALKATRGFQGFAKVRLEQLRARAPLDAGALQGFGAVEAQRQLVQTLERAREALELKAPFEGRVSAVALSPGEVVRAGRPIVTLLESQSTRAVAYVDQSWASQVQLGDEVLLIPIDRSRPSRTGRVTALGPNVAPTPPRFQTNADRPTFSREAVVQVDANGPPLLAGEAFKAEFKRGAAPAAGLVNAR